MRGVFPVLVTPFEEDGSVDFASLERSVEYCLEAGANGLVALANAGEFTTLTDDERRRITDVVVRSVSGAVPVVVGVSGASLQIAAGYAKDASGAGADAVVAMAPYLRAANFQELVAYFRAVGDAADRPVFVQTYHRYPATVLSIEVLAELIGRVDAIQYVKEEGLPAGQRMTQLIGRTGSSLSGVMGGFAGRFVIDEYLRGACGTMPACEVVDVHVAIWRALEAGDHERARDLHARALPLLNIEYLYGPSIYKEVLRRRGIIATAAVRDPGAARLDSRDREELDVILRRMHDMFEGRPPVVPSEATLA
jgi:4-hydroxy-tetrahydrodipicolinate synthase